MRLQGKTAIITGAASGIGKATAKKFVQEGARAILADISRDGGQQTISEIGRDSKQVFFIKADLTKQKDVSAVVDICRKKFGEIDILVNNAGIFQFGTVLDCSEEDWDRLVAINLKSMFLMCKTTIPHMIRQGGGAIVNLASVTALVGARNCTAYSVSKGGIVQLTKSMALDFGKDNIRVNCICPGSIETPMLHKIWQEKGEGKSIEEMRKEYIKGRPLGRIGTPDDIANAVLYLASDEANFATGSVMVVDGGFSAA